MGFITNLASRIVFITQPSQENEILSKPREEAHAKNWRVILNNNDDELDDGQSDDDNEVVENSWNVSSSSNMREAYN